MSQPEQKVEPLKVGGFYRYKDGGEERFKITGEGLALAVFRNKGEIAVLTVATLTPDRYEEVTKADFEEKVNAIIADLKAVLDEKDKVQGGT